MHIDEYATGRHIRMAGKTYRQDLKIINGRVRGDWWRKEGHRLDAADIKDILDARPQTLVVGTGYAESMRVPEATRAVIADQGIELIAESTARAVKTFNRLADEGRAVAGAFHLTC